MKKLNNKGFAISTMLYGILTIVIIVLMLLLGIMRSEYNKKNEATENIYYYLNKCISKQVALENCYKTYNTDPKNPVSCAEEYEAYTLCAGKNNEATSLNKIYLSTQIKDLANVTNSGVLSDPNVDDRYVYTGNNPKNYIKIGNVTGRIMAREADGSIKVLLQQKYSDVFDTTTTTTASNGAQRWENSTLYNLLKNKYNALDDKSNFKKGTFYMAVVYNNDSTKTAIEKIRSKTDISESYFGLPSLEDYLKASSNIKEGSSTYCNLNDTTASSIATALNNCKTNNWMNTSTCTWTSTGYGGITEYITYSSTNVKSTSVTTKCDAYMVVFLNDRTTITLTGEGISDNPYVVN